MTPVLTVLYGSVGFWSLEVLFNTMTQNPSMCALVLQLMLADVFCTIQVHPQQALTLLHFHTRTLLVLF